MDEFQLTNDPAAMQKVKRVLEELRGGKTATVEMFSGLKYTGTFAGHREGSRSENGALVGIGGYIVLQTPVQRVRLDALDIKSWSIGH